MKFLVLILGSTTLVAGGTAITSQQDVRNNMTTQRSHQEHRAASTHGDCVTVETTIFADIAYELQVANGSCYFRYSSGGSFLPDADIDGDGHLESSTAFGSVDPAMPDDIYFGQSVRVRMRDTNPPEIISEGFLSLDPIDLEYNGVDFSKITSRYSMRHIGYLDVNEDGKPDALVELMFDEWGPNQEYKIFYVENISEWPAACASDLNSDGSVEVNDLMQIISDWGPCE